MDNDELFELCKEVYESTGWRGEDGFITTIGGKWIKDVKKGWFDETIDSDGFYPLYTSDYLLEKLPCNKGNHVDLGKWSGGYWSAGWQPNSGRRYIRAVADTPLKALLKLTLALIEAGELVKED